MVLKLCRNWSGLTEKFQGTLTERGCRFKHRLPNSSKKWPRGLSCTWVSPVSPKTTRRLLQALHNLKRERTWVEVFFSFLHLLSHYLLLHTTLQRVPVGKTSAPIWTLESASEAIGWNQAPWGRIECTVGGGCHPEVKRHQAKMSTSKTSQKRKRKWKAQAGDREYVCRTKTTQKVGVW